MHVSLTSLSNALFSTVKLVNTNMDIGKYRIILAVFWSPRHTMTFEGGIMGQPVLSVWMEHEHHDHNENVSTFRS